MEYTLTEAAEKAGVNRATLFRAIKRGRLSGRRQDDGSWLVDAAELHRVYPSPGTEAPSEAETQGPDNALQYAARGGDGRASPVEDELRARIALLERTLDDARAARDAAEARAARLEAEASDARAKALDSLTALLPRLLPPPDRGRQGADPHRGLLARLLGR
jgi:hypothetical protein